MCNCQSTYFDSVIQGNVSSFLVWEFFALIRRIQSHNFGGRGCAVDFDFVYPQLLDVPLSSSANKVKAVVSGNFFSIYNDVQCTKGKLAQEAYKNGYSCDVCEAKTIAGTNVVKISNI